MTGQSDILGAHVRLLSLSLKEDSRGSLLPLEFSELPFVPQRAFVTRVCAAGVTRGGHAHKRCRQILICLSGAIDVELIHAGRTASVRLETPEQALLIEPPVLSRQNLAQANGQLLALMSEPYEPDDYLEAEETAPAVS
jgi:dTDP-4-dehydrorhamnose 3,5-epimerase-like enzyme